MRNLASEAAEDAVWIVLQSSCLDMSRDWRPGHVGVWPWAAEKGEDKEFEVTIQGKEAYQILR